jgi:hypothetical protein
VLAHPSAVMISPAALKKYGNKDIAFHPVGTGPFKFVEWKQTDYVKVKVRRLLEDRAIRRSTDHLEAGGRQQHPLGHDADRRGHFAFRCPSSRPIC